VAVRDTGPAIDPHIFERVFRAFYTTKSTGVGMGLSISRSIIDAHGGRLWVDVNAPRGAVFQFTLPSAASELTTFSAGGSSDWQSHTKTLHQIHLIDWLPKATDDSIIQGA